MALFKKTKKDEEKDAKVAPEVKVEKKEVSDAKEEKKTVKKSEGKNEAKNEKKSDKKPATKKKAAPKTRKVTTTVVAHRVLRCPLITEKTANLAADGVYVFEIAKDSGKIEVRDAIRELYGVTPRRVNVMKVRGKRVKFGRRNGVRRSSKKALVYLKKGEHLDVYGA